MIVQQGAGVVTVGIVAGLAGAALTLRLLQSLLSGASPIDLPVFSGVSAFLAAVAIAAIWIPARRAARINPLEALRAE